MPSAGDFVRASDIAGGVLDYVEGTSDVALSTTNAVYTTLITSNTINVVAGRLYQVVCIPGSHLITAGSGWATGDTWKFRLERDVDGAGYAVMSRSRNLRPNVAVASITDSFAMIGHYSPSANGTLAVRARAAKTAGAATVTSTVSVDSGEGPFEILIDRVGDYASSLH